MSEERFAASGLRLVYRGGTATHGLLFIAAMFQVTMLSALDGSARMACTTSPPPTSIKHAIPTERSCLLWRASWGWQGRADEPS